MQCVRFQELADVQWENRKLQKILHDALDSDDDKFHFRMLPGDELLTPEELKKKMRNRARSAKWKLRKAVHQQMLAVAKLSLRSAPEFFAKLESNSRRSIKGSVQGGSK